MKKTKTTAVKPKSIETPQSIRDSVRASLGHAVHETAGPREYLDLGDRRLNGVLGDPKLGLFYGQILEISGKPSNGKSAIAYDMAATAQTKDGCVVLWVDFERSFNAEWAATRGLKAEDIILFQPYIGKFKKKKKKTFGRATEPEEEETKPLRAERLSTAQELLLEVEETLLGLHDKFPQSKLFVVIDSVAAMLVEEEVEAGLTNHNMRTSNALPVFLGKLLRRWIAVLGETRTIAVFINQLRSKPGIAFGDPDYTPGGNALPFYAHVRVRMRRVKGGRVLQKGKVVGIKGILRNDKNKAGGVEGDEIGFKIMFSGKSQFLEASAVKEVS